jgi:holo-[acyl-carrier protein] synthase
VTAHGKLRSFTQKSRTGARALRERDARGELQLQVNAGTASTTEHRAHSQDPAPRELNIGHSMWRGVLSASMPRARDARDGNYPDERLGSASTSSQTARIDHSLERFGERFLQRVFTAGEIEYCQSMKFPARHFAARFAAKEAVSKAFGTGIGKAMGWKDIDVHRKESGEPFVRLVGGRPAARRGAQRHRCLNQPQPYRSSRSRDDRAGSKRLALPAPPPGCDRCASTRQREQARGSGSGIGAKKPRISPALNMFVWMFR